ncbi:carbon-nitrogen hydrolase family protein [Gynuella sunshinyii]|uniref:Putative amidohydrolase n=1 Tax=Gynuella sunshinyii YC6258 TaxID=1445510 RepID=A0A0C5VSY1_9GAMM|nr:carbon-nitrogen hydrolase family protein [Gynuella sunshinyii]AJQ97291.1 putative amidohydrolase [Gynuella sunshinyii YC6258]
MSTVALLQMTSSTDIAVNLETVSEAFRQLAEQHPEVDLVLLPENWASYGNRDITRESRQSLEQQRMIMAHVSALARRYRRWLIAGTIPFKYNVKQKPWACCPVFDGGGRLVAEYRKIHLFDAIISDRHNRYQESATYCHGSTLTVVSTPVGRVGLSVCYDLRFPEQYQRLRAMGAEVLVAPAAFTRPTGMAHWELLNRARAVENACYMLAPAQVGTHDDGRQTWGHSMIVEPWGAVQACLADETGWLVGQIDLARVHAMRQTMPNQEHRIQTRQRSQ